MKTTTKFAAITLATLSFAAASVVLAHPGMGMGQGTGAGAGYGPAAEAGAGPGAGMGYGMRGGMQGPQTAADTAARLADLKTELKITARQDAAWQGYATVVQQQAEQRQAMRTQMWAQMQQDPQAAANVDRAALRESMMGLRDSQLAARDAALKDLYAVLTPEQKALADQRLMSGPGHRMARRAPAK